MSKLSDMQYSIVIVFWKQFEVSDKIVKTFQFLNCSQSKLNNVILLSRIFLNFQFLSLIRPTDSPNYQQNLLRRESNWNRHPNAIPTWILFSNLKKYNTCRSNRNENRPTQVFRSCTWPVLDVRDLRRFKTKPRPNAGRQEHVERRTKKIGKSWEKDKLTRSALAPVAAKTPQREKG